MVAKVSHAQWQKPPMTLEQTAYRFWGARLERACPNGSLQFRRVAPPWGGVTDEGGGSWGDCQPWVRRHGQEAPELCASALHEAGHEIGLPDFPGTGGLMDNTRLIVGSRAVYVSRHGRARRAQVWTGVPAICQPGR